MKTINLLFVLSTLLLSSFTLPVSKASTSFDGKAYDNSQMMDFSDSTAEEVKTYYDYDTLKTLKGNELKEHLYQKISADNYFLKYNPSYETKSGVSCWYRITDRNWSLSQQIDPATYKFNSESPQNGGDASKYRLVNMYFEDSANQDLKKATNNYINSCVETEGITETDYTSKQKPVVLDENNNPILNSQGKPIQYIQVDKEHVWAKNHGFPAISDDSINLGAPTDLHHLVAADHNTNSSGHNDNFYGEVEDKNNATEIKCYYGDGSYATSGWRGKGKDGEIVFEPTDEWKGDIARCLFYMVTRYGHDKEGCHTHQEPYLEINENGIDDNDKFMGYHPYLDTYIKWNKLDPVSDYEIHRNNLIYKNVQKNRNPYIDFPSLVTRVFDASNIECDFNGKVQLVGQDHTSAAEDGNSGQQTEEETKEIKSNMNDFRKDGEYKIHLNSNYYSLPIVLSPDDEIVVSYDDTIISLDTDKKTIYPLKMGSCKLKYDFVNANVSYQTTVEVVDNLTATIKDENDNIINDGDTLTLEDLESKKYKLLIETPNKFGDELYRLSSSNDSVVECSPSSNGELEIFKKGVSTISFSVHTSIRSDNKSQTDLMSFKIVIKSFKRSLDWSFYFIIGVIAFSTIISITFIVIVIINKALKNREHRV